MRYRTTPDDSHVDAAAAPGKVGLALPRPARQSAERQRAHLAGLLAAARPSRAAVRDAAAWVRVEQQDCLQFLGSLPAESVDLIVTDPAYSGMNQHLKLGRGRIVGDYAARGRDDGGGNGRWFSEFHDDPATFGRFLSECRRVLRNDRHVYLMFDSFSLLTLGHLAREVFAVKNLIAWDKLDLGMGHYFRRRHEFVLFAVKGRRKLSRRDLPDVWPIKRVRRPVYPTEKPVELFEMMMLASAEPGFVVCDPFAGSGSSAVAAIRHGCSFIGCDVSERAVEITRARAAQEAARDDL